MSVGRWRPIRLERLDPFRDLLEVQSEMTDHEGERRHG